MTHIKWPNELVPPPQALSADLETMRAERDAARNTHWQVEAMQQNALLHDALTRAETAEAKLAKAVEFFQEVRRNGDTRFASMAIAVLAELEKAK